MEVINKYITIKACIDEGPQDSDFVLKADTISLVLDPHCRDIVVKNLYISIDPYQINRMKSFSVSQKSDPAAVSITPGKMIEAYGVGKVVASEHPDFQKGDLVVGLLTWGEYSIVKDGFMLNKLDTMGLPLTYHINVLGTSGLTAYAGFFEVCKPKKGEKVFVSTASGSVGNLVGQYAKLFGCYVVGSAGSKQKVDLLKEKLGFDDAFNYKDETDLRLALERYFPDGIDIYFDNVGGEMLEAAVSNMNNFGRVAACGAIVEYTDSKRRTSPDMIAVIYKRIKIQGFISPDFMHIYNEFISTTVEHLRNDRIKVIEDISFGVESIPSAFLGLFRGDNVGKKIVKIADE